MICAGAPPKIDHVYLPPAKLVPPVPVAINEPACTKEAQPGLIGLVMVAVGNGSTVNNVVLESVHP